MTGVPLHIRWRALLPLVLFAVAFVLAGPGHDPGADGLAIRAAAARVLPFYDVVVTTPGQAPVTRTGIALDVPVSIDANRDGTLDLAVRTGLVNLSGLLSSPLSLANVLTPHVSVDRLASPSTPPVRVVVRIPLGFPGSPATTFVEFGYDTGTAGAIPAHFDAVLGGLVTLFQPLEAVVDTSSVVDGLDLPLPGLADAAPGYQGPLTLVGGLASPTTELTGELAFDPFPGRVTVGLGADDDGLHTEYHHESTAEVDLAAHLDVDGADGAIVADARIDRLPADLTFDLDAARSTGRVEFSASQALRPADIGVTLTATPDDGPTTTGRLDVEGLAPTMVADWDVAPGSHALATFDSPDGPTGAIEAHLLIADGEPTVVEPIVPTSAQFLDVQSATTDDDETEAVVAARLQRLDGASVARDADGLVATYDLGDGTSAFDVNLDVDGRAEDDGLLVRGRTTIDPLPSTATVTLATPGDDAFAEPLHITYDAASSMDVRGDLAVFADGDTCGDLGSACFTLDLDDIPSHLEVRVRERTDADDGDRRERRLELERPAGAAAPDIDASVVVGTEDGPLAADARVADLPPFLQARLVDVPVPPDPDAEPNAPEERVLERLELRPCDAPIGPTETACPDGTDAVVDEIAFEARTFVERPADLPVPVVTAPNHATVVGRGDAIEASVRVLDVGELLYLDRDGFLGVRSTTGGGQPLAVAVDIDTADATVVASSLVDPLPAVFDVCLRRPGATTTAPLSEATAACVDAGAPPSELAIGYRGHGTTFDIEADVDATLRDVVLTEGEAPTTVAVQADLTVDHVPGELNATLDAPPTPEDDDAVDPPMTFHVDTGTATEQIDATIRAALSIGGLRCDDTRTPAPGQRAACLAATIEDLPTAVDVRFAPADPTDNLSVVTSGTSPLTVRDLDLRSLALGDDGAPQAITVTGEINDLPRSLVGTIHLPDVIDLTATPALGRVDLEARNFVGADPTADIPAPRDGGAEPDHTLAVVTQGDDARAVIDLAGVEHVGFTSPPPVVKDGVEEPAPGTRSVDVDLDHAGDDLRVYADLDGVEQRILGDVVLADLPLGVSVCFRGPLPEDFDGEVTDDHCGRTPDDQTGLEVVQQRAGGASDALTDIHAFVRFATDGGTEVTSGRVDVVDVPPIVRARFGPDVVDAGGFDDDGETALGIGLIDAHVATFDIADHGYAVPPFEPRPVATAPFGVNRPAAPHLSAAVTDVDTEASLRLGGDSSATPASSLERIRLAPEACAKPAGDGFDDFPFLPPAAPSATTYTCARLDVTPPASGRADPLAIAATIDKDDQRLVVRDAGLTDLPDFVQLNLAVSPVLDLEDPTDPLRPLRDLCPVFNAPRPRPDRCLPPLVRFDSSAPAGTPILFGTVELGSTTDLAQLVATPPFDAELHLDAVPNESRWVGDPSALATDTGVRARVATFVDEADADTQRLAAILALRIGVPGSLTIDPIRTWSVEDASSGTDGVPAPASDLRLHYAVRDGDGEIVDRLGHLAAQYVDAESGAHVLLGDGAELALVADPHVDDRDQVVGGTPRSGLSIPGEASIDLSIRSRPRTGQTFVQLDGRVSTPMDIRARAQFPADGALPDVADMHVLGVPAVEPGRPVDEPSFRVQAEVITAPSGGAAARIGRSAAAAADEAGIESGSCPEPGTKCTRIVVDPGPVRAIIDFSRGAQPQARLVRAVVRVEKVQGVQIQAFRNVDGTGGPGYVTVSASASIDRLAIEITRIKRVLGIPIAGLLVHLEASIDAGFSLDQVHDFSWRQGLIHTKATNADGDPNFDPGLAVVGPIDFNVHELHAVAFGGPAVITASFPLGVAGPLQLQQLSCPTGAIIDAALNVIPGYPGALAIAQPNRFEVTAGETDNFIVWPFADPRLLLSPLGTGLEKLAEVLVKPFLCLLDTDLELATANHPGDPIGLDTHRIAGAPAAAPPVAGAISDPPDDDDPTIFDPPLDEERCGRYEFAEIRIDVTITVDDSAGVNCPAGSEGTLELVADRITIGPNGHIDGDGVVLDGPVLESAAITPFSFEEEVDEEPGGPGDEPDDPDDPPGGGGPPDEVAPAADSGGGGGHGGRGGDAGATNGGGGDAYGDRTAAPVTEPGAPGSGLNGSGGITGALFGRGGASIVLHARLLDVQGKVTADGEAADSLGSGPDDPECAGLDDGGNPTTPPPASGGGAGGGIVLDADDLSIAPTAEVHAHGGAGGNAPREGGGGGAGGIVKLIAATSPTVLADLTGLAVGGAGAVATCDRDGEPSGHAGEDGLTQAFPLLRSTAVSFDAFVQPADLRFRFSAGAAPVNGNEDVTVIVCGIPGDRVGDGTVGSRPPDPAFQNPGAPCGSSLTARPIELGRLDTSGTSFRFDPADPDAHVVEAASPLTSGIWSVWTVLDTADTGVEPNPTVPDIVFQVDADPPTPTITATPAVVGVLRSVELDIDLSDGIVTLLGCTEEPIHDPSAAVVLPCSAGTSTVRLRTPDDGTKLLRVRVADRVGNVGEATARVDVNTTNPGFETRVSPATPDRRNGWYSTSPTFQLAGTFAESVFPAPGSPFWAVRVDDGTELTCTDDLCDFPGDLPAEALPGTGTHVLHVTPVDSVGNRLFDDDDPNTASPMATTEVRIDGQPPTSRLVTVPSAPDGEGGWFTVPVAVHVAAVDQPGASGLVTAEGEAPGAGTYLGVDGSPPALVGEPVVLADGVHQLCWFAEDVASNREAQRCETIRVDATAPTVAIATVPGVAGGLAGTFVSATAVGASATDVGSGMVPDPAGDPALTCSARPVRSAPAGTCVSVDGGAFAPVGAPVSLGDGEHGVRAFATDAAGNRSGIVTRRITVDTVAPRSQARVIPPAPAAAGLFRSRPAVALFADDDPGVGVGRAEIELDGGPWLPWTTPVDIPAGAHTVRHRAVDAAGNVGPIGSLTLGVDPIPVTVRATGPTPATLSRLVGLLLGQRFTLRWTVAKPDGADTAGPVRVKVIVTNLVGQVVRSIDGGTVTVAPGQTVAGSVTWDGRGGSLLDLLPVGVYRYRVVAVDAVGNTAQSDHSTALTVVL